MWNIRGIKGDLFVWFWFFFCSSNWNDLTEVRQTEVEWGWGLSNYVFCHVNFDMSVKN